MRSFSGCSNSSVVASGCRALATPDMAGSVMWVLCLTRAARVNGTRGRRHLRRPSRPGDDRVRDSAVSGARELQIACVQRRHLPLNGAHIGIIRDDIVGGLEACRAGYLCIEDRLRLCARRAVPGMQAPDLQRLFAVDHQHAIDVRAEILLDEQRDHQDLIRTARRGRACLERSADRRMRQVLQVRARPGIREHDLAQRRAIEMSVGCENPAPEALYQPLERRLPGLDDLACHLVAVEDWHAERTEELGGGGLAAGDAPGETDAEHARTGGRHHGCEGKRLRYRVTSSWPHMSTTQPAAARNGPKAIGVARLCARIPRSVSPTTAPTTAAIRITGSSICHPSQAPSAAKSLKSPYPMPSFPVRSRNR